MSASETLRKPRSIADTSALVSAYTRRSSGSPKSGSSEPETIWALLGSQRLAEPIAEHRPDLVLHGHGHRGSFAGHIEDVPVFNVGIPVIGRDFWIFELEPERGLVREPEEAARTS